MCGSPSITFELLKEDDNSVLCERLKKKAVETFRTQQWQGVGWSSVDMRVHGQGLPELVTVSPPWPRYSCPQRVRTGKVGSSKTQRELNLTARLDAVIKYSFPGSHRAFIDVLITSQILQKRIDPT